MSVIVLGCRILGKWLSPENRLKGLIFKRSPRAPLPFLSFLYRGYNKMQHFRAEGELSRLSVCKQCLYLHVGILGLILSTTLSTCILLGSSLKNYGNKQTNAVRTIQSRGVLSPKHGNGVPCSLMSSFKNYKWKFFC